MLWGKINQNKAEWVKGRESDKQHVRLRVREPACLSAVLYSVMREALSEGSEGVSHELSGRRGIQAEETSSLKA